MLYHKLDTIIFVLFLDGNLVQKKSSILFFNAYIYFKDYIIQAL